MGSIRCSRIVKLCMKCRSGVLGKQIRLDSYRAKGERLEYRVSLKLNRMRGRLCTKSCNNPDIRLVGRSPGARVLGGKG